MVVIREGMDRLPAQPHMLANDRNGLIVLAQKPASETRAEHLDAGCIIPATVVICSRNRPELLEDSVQSVLDGYKLPSELIVVDQSDEPHPVLRSGTHPRGTVIRYERTNRIGECPAKNLALAVARHEIIVFTDDDVLVSPDWLGSLVRHLVEAGPNTVVTGRVLPAKTDVPGGVVGATKVDTAPAVYEGRGGETVLFPMNMAMYRSVYTDIGGFDERLGAGGRFSEAEDNDYGYRLREAHYRIRYVPDACVYHARGVQRESTYC
jgi:GT2 family glycosyltransferase